MSQLELFSQPKARRTDPDTSRAAALSVLPMVGSQENRVLELFAIHGPSTDDEICTRAPQWHPPTLKTCRSRLSKRGLLIDSGARRPSLRGKDQIVWKLKGGN